MGRPLNKKYFGPPTAGGSEIKCDFYTGATITEGYIVKQLGSKKFRVAAIGTPGTKYDCFLTTGKLANALTQRADGKIERVWHADLRSGSVQAVCGGFHHLRRCPCARRFRQRSAPDDQAGC